MIISHKKQHNAIEVRPFKFIETENLTLFALIQMFRNPCYLFTSF